MEEVRLDGLGVVDEVLGIFIVVFTDSDEELWPGDDALVAVFWGEVGTAEEGASVWEAKDVEGPAAFLLDHLDGFHVDMVEVRAFFAIYFNADEITVHEVCDIGVFEGFVGHDVAPVAGGVADGDEDGFIEAFGFLEGFVGEGPPMNGVIGVLAEIEA